MTLITPSQWPRTTHFALHVPRLNTLNAVSRLVEALGDQVEAVGLGIRALVSTEAPVVAGDALTLLSNGSAEAANGTTVNAVAVAGGSLVMADMVNFVAVNSPTDLPSEGEIVTGIGGDGAIVSRPIESTPTLVADEERTVSNPTGFRVDLVTAMFDGTKALLTFEGDALVDPYVDTSGSTGSSAYVLNDGMVLRLTAGGTGTEVFVVYWPCWIPPQFANFYAGASAAFRIRAVLTGAATIAIAVVDQDGAVISNSPVAMTSGEDVYELLDSVIAALGASDRGTLCFLRVTIDADAATVVDIDPAARRRFQPRTLHE